MRFVAYTVFLATLLVLYFRTPSSIPLRLKIHQASVYLFYRSTPTLCFYLNRLEPLFPRSFQTSQPYLSYKDYLCLDYTEMSQPASAEIAQDLPAHPPSTTRVRLLTQNIFIRPSGINNNGNDYKSERLNYFAQNLFSSYDVICFQELFRFSLSCRYKGFIAQAKNAGFNYTLSSPPRGLTSFGIDAGLTILSRFPIVASDFKQYDRGVHSDYWSLKGVLYAKIRINPPVPEQSVALPSEKLDGDDKDAQYFHIFNTHTQSSYGTLDLTETSVIKRLYQLYSMHQFIEKMLQKNRQDDEPVFLLGDMNVDSRTHIINDPTDSSPSASDPQEKVGSTTPNYEQDVRDGKLSSPEYLAFKGVLEGYGLPDPTLFGLEKDDTLEGPSKYNFTDLHYSLNGYHPVTFGNTKIDGFGNLIPMETVLTTKSDNMVMHSLDYILSLNTPDSELQIGSVKAQPHFATEGINNFTQISDHYGMSADLIFKF
ncbi:Sphingomyelinase [Smittium mucronatum]|uniref:sphingomyelin phosphodiesterase n=1 Tax=Smittium mucronatum TaxID=133383 RepID=A0A1R0H2V8_9FUNG|nr:Sphingomyelinase [Smittium mucronatum]